MKKRESSMGRWRTCTRTIVAGALLAVVGVAVVPEVAQAEVNLPPDPSWVTNVSQGNNRDDGFKVKAMVKLGNVVYIGGGFTQIAPDNKAFSPSGGAGGNPNQAGIDQPYLFAVDATTGEAIQTFRPKLNAPVEALEVGPNNTVYVGGTFTIVNGVPLNGFAILDGSTGLLKSGIAQRSFANDAAPGSVWAIKLYGTLLYVGGNFTTVQNCGLAVVQPGQGGPLQRRQCGRHPSTASRSSWPAAARCRPSPSTRPTRPGCTSADSSAGLAPAPAPRPIAGTGFLAAFRQDNAALVQTWVPGLTPPPPGPGGVVRDPEVRGLAANAGIVYAGVGGGGGRFYALNGAAGAAQPYRRTYNTDGDVQAVAITPQGDRVFVGGHFTRVDTPHTSIPVGTNARCQMFSITTGAGHAIQATPNTSNGGHYGPFAVIADSVNDSWWGGQLTVLGNGWVQDDDPPGTNPVATSCGTGDQKNKIGQTAAGYVGGVAHLRSSPGFGDGAAPSAPTITSVGPGIFNGINLTWSAAADNVKVTAYYIRATGPGLLEANQVVGTQWGTDLGFSIPPARLNANAGYQFRVCAVDLGDNETCSAPVNATTAAGAPTVPGGTLRGYGEFFPVNPSRIYDTRPGTGQPGQGQVITSGATRTVQVAGLAGVPGDAMMVALNVTVTEPTASGFLTVYPTGAPRPTASNLNFTPGQTVPNLVNARLGSGGRIDLFNLAGNSQVVIDVVGWYGSQATNARGGRVTTQSPVRVLDTRPGLQIGPFGKVGSAAGDHGEGGARRHHGRRPQPHRDGADEQHVHHRVARRPAGSPGGLQPEPEPGADPPQPGHGEGVAPGHDQALQPPRGDPPDRGRRGHLRDQREQLHRWSAAAPQRPDAGARHPHHARSPTVRRRRGATTMQAIDDATSASVAGFVMNVTATEGTVADVPHGVPDGGAGSRTPRTSTCCRVRTSRTSW